MSATIQTGFIPTITAMNPFGETVLGLVIIAVTTALFFTAEGLYTASQVIGNRYQHLMDYTAPSDDKALVIHQDISKYPEAKPILLSDNEPSGIEFAYSFFLFVNPATFTGDAVLHHVWHKGYGCVWPLMGPGVFFRSDTNALRVVMNTYENPYTFIDIMNIPIKKWFHVVLNCKKGGLEVHINGNLANKIRFENTLPYMNYQDIILFSTANYTLRGSTTPAVGSEMLDVRGSFKGFMSEFIYTRYSLSFTEIQALLNAGPSKRMKTQSMELPPYLAESWWATKYNSA
jgi:hypothetical protein